MSFEIIQNEEQIYNMCLNLITTMKGTLPQIPFKILDPVSNTLSALFLQF